MSGISKSTVDKFIQENYDELKRICKGSAYKACRKYDPEILISEAYMHVLKFLNVIEDENMLKRFLIAKINIEVRYSQSKTSRENTFYDKEDIPMIIETDHIEYKIEQEKKYQKIENYYINEKDRINQLIYEAYVIKGHNSIKKLSKYFNISCNSSRDIINQLKIRIKNEKV